MIINEKTISDLSKTNVHERIKFLNQYESCYSNREGINIMKGFIEELEHGINQNKK